MQRLEEERARKEQEEQEAKLKRELEESKLEEEIERESNTNLFELEEAKGDSSAMPPPPDLTPKDDVSQNNEVVMAEDSLNNFQRKKEEEPVIQIPPDSEKRNFNENDILGDFDRDDKGNVMVLQDDSGNYVDKQGRRVNEKGYLLDPKTGDVIENDQKTKMFD